MTIEVALLKSIRSSGLSIGGDVDSLVSQHVHAGSQQSCITIKIQKLLHEKSKLPRKFQPIRLANPNLGDAVTKMLAFVFISFLPETKYTGIGKLMKVRQINQIINSAIQISNSNTPTSSTTIAMMKDHRYTNQLILGFIMTASERVQAFPVWTTKQRATTQCEIRSWTQKISICPHIRQTTKRKARKLLQDRILSTNSVKNTVFP